MAARSKGATALPEDLLRAVYSIAHVITLKDRQVNAPLHLQLLRVPFEPHWCTLEPQEQGNGPPQAMGSPGNYRDGFTQQHSPAHNKVADTVVKELTHSSHPTPACRLRGLAVCRTWKRVLSDMPILRFDLYSKEEEEVRGICRWAMVSQPCVIELFQHSDQELAIQAVHSLRRKVKLQSRLPSNTVQLTGTSGLAG